MEKSENQAISILLKQAKDAVQSWTSIEKEKKTQIFSKIQKEIIKNKKNILLANAADIADAVKNNLSTAIVDRLLIDEIRINNILRTLEEIARLKDPIGEILEGKTLQNGVELQKKRVPLGILLCIYESRPNVTIDIAALCIKSSNVCILKGGKEAQRTNLELAKCISQGLKKCSNSLENAVILVPNASKEMVGDLLQRRDFIDVVVPRGGEKLIQYVMKNSSIPVIAHDKGLCNLYIDKDANEKMAISIAINSKKQRPGVCNAVENIVLHKDFSHKNAFIKKLLAEKIKVKLDKNLLRIFDEKKNVEEASEEDWSIEYLDLIVSICQVENIKQACEFINTYGSGHTDAIVTNNLESLQFFQQNVDSSCIAANVSTRYHDGEMFEMGAEVGISTQKLHVRGVMTLKDLTTTKYLLVGSGQVRT